MNPQDTVGAGRGYTITDEMVYYTREALRERRENQERRLVDSLITGIFSSEYGESSARGNAGGAGGTTRGMAGSGVFIPIDEGMPISRPNNNQEVMAEVTEVMKVRHLSKNERAHYHRPKADWKESPKGEVCKSSCTLEVEDIISRHCK